MSAFPAKYENDYKFKGGGISLIGNFGNKCTIPAKRAYNNIYLFYLKLIK